MFAGLTAASRGKVRSLVPLSRRLSGDMPGSPSSETPDLGPDIEKQRRPKKDPGDCSVLLFPGQGSQFVGMGRGLLKYPNVKEMFTVARKILGYDLLSLCMEGPEAELMKTVHCQPAVFITSLAAVERLNQENPKVGVFFIMTKKGFYLLTLWHFKKVKYASFFILPYENITILNYVWEHINCRQRIAASLQSPTKDTW